MALGGSSVEGELTGNTGMVTGFAEHEGPSMREMRSYSAFYKDSMKLMENFCRVEPKQELAAKFGLALPTPGGKLYGRKALTYMLECVKMQQKHRQLEQLLQN